MNAEKIVVRTANTEDLRVLLQLEIEAWPEDSRANTATYRSRLEIFPDGIYIAETDGKILGAAVTEIINWKLLQNDFSWAQITDNGTIQGTHNPEGNCVYGVNLSVKPNHYGNKVVEAIEKTIAKVIVERNLWMGVIGSRMPGFARYVAKQEEDGNNFEIDELAMHYIFAQTKSGKALDPEIHIYKKCGLDVVRPLKGYFPDPNSLNYGVLMIWKNPEFVHLIRDEVLRQDFVVV